MDVVGAAIGGIIGAAVIIIVANRVRRGANVVAAATRVLDVYRSYRPLAGPDIRTFDGPMQQLVTALRDYGHTVGDVK
jgi:hypothetical protein